jgi:hypothetical protein
MGKWFRVQSVSSAIGRSMVLILFMASLIAVVAMVTLFYSVPDAKAINLSGSLRMQAYRMAYEIEKDQVVLVASPSLNRPFMPLSCRRPSAGSRPPPCAAPMVKSSCNGK